MTTTTNTTEWFSNDELAYYSRQLILESWDIDAQWRLKNSVVVIIGLGGLGAPLAMWLARAGVGQLILIDHDTIDISNLPRQCLYQINDVGSYKAVACAKHLSLANPYITILPVHQNFRHLTIEQWSPHLVIDCTDHFNSRDDINQLCVVNQLPLLSVSAIGLEGQMALFLPKSGCYACVFGQEKVTDTDDCATTGVLNTTTAVMSSMAAHHALLFLSDLGTPLQQKLWLWQSGSLTPQQLEFTKDQHCLVCGEKSCS